MATERHTVSFRVDHEQKVEIDAYAKAKGLDKAANLARMALFSYMLRNPLRTNKKKESATAVHSEGITGEGSR